MKRTLGLFLICILLECSSPSEKAKNCLDLGDYERAIRLYNQILDRSPKNFEGRYGLGLALYQKAFAMQERGLPNIELWQRSIEELQCAGRLDSAPSMREILANACYHLAVAWDNEKNSLQVKRNLEEALRYNPASVEARHRLGTLSYEARDYSKAREIFQTVLELNPSYVPAYQNLGSSLWALGKIREADAIWKAGLQIDPHNEFMKSWHAKAIRRIGKK